MKSPTAMSRFIRGIVENSGPLNDGRPFATDLYLVMLLAACDDMYDMREGCKAWVEGDWDTALEMLTLKDLPEEHWPLVASFLLASGKWSEHELTKARE